MAEHGAWRASCCSRLRRHNHAVPSQTLDKATVGATGEAALAARMLDMRLL